MVVQDGASAETAKGAESVNPPGTAARESEAATTAPGTERVPMVVQDRTSAETAGPVEAVLALGTAATAGAARHARVGRRAGTTENDAALVPAGVVTRPAALDDSEDGDEAGWEDPLLV